MLKLYPRLGYHSVQMRFSARLIWASMLARRASSGQEGVPLLQKRPLQADEKKCYTKSM